MHDIKYIRQNPEEFNAGLARRGLGGLLFIMLLLIASFSPALAVGKCDSILNLGKDCYSEKPLIIAHGIEVKLVSSGKQKIDYPVTEELKHFEEMAINYCPNKKCTCEENIGYVQFDNQARGVKIINIKEKKQAENYKCDVSEVYVQRLPTFIYSSSELISIVVHKMQYGRGAGGSCHGEYQFTTYNAETGDEYKLNDIVVDGSMPTLREGLVSQLVDIIAKKNNAKTRTDWESIKKSMQNHLENVPTVIHGFVVENGKLYTNTNSFILSCADGNFFPVEVPEKFIKPEFLQKLKK